MFWTFLLFIFVIALVGKLSVVNIVEVIAIVAASNLLKKQLLYNQAQHFNATLKINFALFSYFIALVKEMIMSSYKVCWIILFKPKVVPLVDSRSTKTFKGNCAAMALYGTSITLTPSTITVDINDRYVIVHSLTPNGMIGAKFLERNIIKTQ